jgi:hypothetical protein
LEAGCWLAKRWSEDIAITAQIRNVERVEGLSENCELITFPVSERLGQAEVLCERRIAELVVRWYRDRLEDRASGILRTGDVLALMQLTYTFQVRFYNAARRRSARRLAAGR